LGQVGVQGRLHVGVLPRLEGLGDRRQANGLDAEVLGQALGQRRALVDRVGHSVQEPPEELRELVDRRLVHRHWIPPHSGMTEVSRVRVPERRGFLHDLPYGPSSSAGVTSQDTPPPTVET
jgi:hypothetical protein